MPADPVLEQRLTVVEKAIVAIQEQLADQPPASDWLARFTGAFQDEPAFSEVVAIGRQLREADRPQDGKDS